MQKHLLCTRCGGPYPGEDGEEREGDGRPGSVPTLPQRVVLMLGHLPLVCQETEADKPHEGPECWRKDIQRGRERGVDGYIVELMTTLQTFCLDLYWDKPI